MNRGINYLLKQPKKCMIKNNFGLKHFPRNFYITSEIREKKNDFSKTVKKNLPYTIASKYEPFIDENVSEIFDVEKEQNEIKQEIFYDEFEGINLNRGITGVFEIEEVVSILKKENGKDVCVVKIPPEYRYADFMVIVTGRSTRHMLAMIEFLRKVYKIKKNNNDLIPRIEGKNSKDWLALDLGNIVVHVLSEESRKYYDLETLWAVGKEYDTLTHKKSAAENILTNYSKILEDLSPNKITN